LLHGMDIYQNIYISYISEKFALLKRENSIGRSAKAANERKKHR
jgi:hypothetical protein